MVPRAQLRALLNRLLVAAVVMNLGFALSGGIYEVIWSLFLTTLGASIDFIGLTFALFSLPALLLSAYAGQGIFGASTQIGIAAGAIAAGWLFAIDVRWPFWAFAIMAVASVLVGILVAKGSPHLRRAATVPVTGLLVICLLAACAAPLPGTPVPTQLPASPTATLAATPPLSPTPSGTPTTEPATPSVTPSPTGSAAPTPQTYVVQPGDSLSSIAEAFGLTVEQLLAANPQITDPDHIEVGAVLTIPSPDAPITVPTADQILDPTGDLLDEADRSVFAPGYIDLTALEARVDAEMLFIELLLVAAPPPADPEVEQLDYSVYVDTDGDRQADYQLRASNSVDPDVEYAGTLTDLGSGATSSADDFPGNFSVGDTIRFEVFRQALGTTRRYGVAVIGVRRFFPGGADDPEVEAAIDRIPEQAWPRPNAQWLEVGL